MALVQISEQPKIFLSERIQCKSSSSYISFYHSFISCGLTSSWHNLRNVYFIVFSVSLQSPQLINAFGDKEVTKLASHADGKHYLALTNEGDVYSWGNGDGGRLGHGDNM